MNKFILLICSTRGTIAIHAAQHFYGREEDPPLVREVGCEGTKDELRMCPMSWGISHLCDQTCQAGVGCYGDY